MPTTPIAAILTEADWKSHGLTTLTEPERKANKQKVTEALQDYALLDKRVTNQPWDTKDRAQVLARIKSKLTEAANNYKTNKTFVAHVNQMIAALPDEKTRANKIAIGITMTQAFDNPYGYEEFLKFAKARHCDENLLFLKNWQKMNAAALVDTFVRPTAPRQLNLGADVVAKLEKDPRDSSALKAAVDHTKYIVEKHTLPLFANTLIMQ